jgi:hypothetical protein
VKKGAHAEIPGVDQQGQEAGKNDKHCFCEPHQDPIHFQDGAF